MIKSNLPTGSPSNIRMQGTRDMLQVKDPYKNQWIDWQQTGVIVLPSTITITTTTLEGHAVICQIGEYSKTTTFVNGVAYFDMIFETGTATITCGEWSTTVEVTAAGGAYIGELEESVELLLYETGYGALNGAKLVESGYDNYLSFKCESGSIDNKKLYFITDSTPNSVCIYRNIYSNEVMLATEYLYYDGSVKKDSIGFSGSANTEYSYKFNHKGITDFYLVVTKNGNSLYLTTYIKKIWLK